LIGLFFAFVDGVKAAALLKTALIACGLFIAFLVLESVWARWRKTK